MLRRLAMLLVLVGLVAGAGWLVFVSSVLAVERVQVSGVRTVSADRITGAAVVPVGEPLASVDVDEIRRRVEDVPVVARADISRSWPHTVSIEVTERTPVAAVRGGGAGYRLIDADGVMYRTVSDPRDLPVMSAGEHPRAAVEGAAVLAALPRSLAKRVAEVEATTMDSIELHLQDGRTVVWGSAERSALKAQVLGALIERKASVYDVSVPGVPTVRVG